jgi:hypothetical protein
MLRQLDNCALVKDKSYGNTKTTKSIAHIILFAGAIFVTSAATSPAYADGPFDEIQQWQEADGSFYYSINRPNPQVPGQDYWTVQIPANSYIQVLADGCVQTGGSGKTWKRYVDPDSDSLYHGLIRIPGAINTLSRFSDIQMLVGGWSIQYHVSNSTFLTLGYEDDGYGDNGYWGWDPGTHNQCVGKPDAYVMLRVSPNPFY